MMIIFGSWFFFNCMSLLGLLTFAIGAVTFRFLRNAYYEWNWKREQQRLLELDFKVWIKLNKKWIPPHLIEESYTYDPSRWQTLKILYWNEFMQHERKEEVDLKLLKDMHRGD